MRLFRPRPLFLPVPTSQAAALNTAEPAYIEPEFSRALLFMLLAVLLVAQVAWQGIRFGFHAPHDSLAFSLLEYLHRPATFAADPFRFVAAACASPFWELMALVDKGIGQKYALFSGVLFAARAAGAFAVFRLAERTFGHALGALISVALWLGAGDALALHHAFLAPSDVALALWLWAIVLWNEDRPAWALLCGLATGVDALPSIAVFIILWLAAWLRPIRDVAHFLTDWWWKKARHGTSNRLTWSGRSLFLFVLAALPAWNFWATHFSASGDWWASVAKSAHALAALSWPQEPAGALWQTIIFLLAGVWCWRHARGASRPLAVVVVALGCAAALAGWLFALQQNLALTAAGTRLAPLAVSLGLLSMTHVLERGAARRGSSGLLGIFLLTAIVVLMQAPLVLIWGILALESIARWQRNRPAKGSSPQITRHALSSGRFALLCTSAGRWALLGFVLLWCACARLAVGARLRNDGGVLSARQNADWLQIQLWAKASTPRNAVFVAQKSGFRAFSNRAVFCDRSEEKWGEISPDFARVWQARYPLVAPLKNPKVRLNSGVLLQLRARGVTHLVVRTGDTHWNQLTLTLRPIGRNRSWTIYRVR